MESISFETIQWSPTFAALAAAMLRIQSAALGASKTRTNPHLKNKYADLGSIWEASRAALADEQIAVFQVPHGGPDAPQVTTRLVHCPTGEWVMGSLTIRPAKSDAQGVGSAISYARRYALMSMLNVIPQDEDDGNAASVRQALNECVQMARSLGLTDAQFVDNVSGYYGTRDLGTLNAQQVSELHARLRSAVESRKHQDSSAADAASNQTSNNAASAA